MPGVSPEQVAEWRRQLQADQAELRRMFEEDGATMRLLRRHSQRVDQLLRSLWQHSALPAGLSLIAVGGYGRGELFPHSDVDLLILLPDQHDAAHDAALEALIGLFWDIGLAVGHSVRSLAECLDEATKDATVLTNLLEARWLAGSRQQFRRLRAELAASLDAEAFFRLKLLEQQQRHARFNDSAYNLEPNVKESPGGLRDLQNVLRIAQGCGLGGSWDALIRHGLITPAEARQIRHHELFVQMLRIRLHYLAGRREDRLLFDYQGPLAERLGLASTPRKRASEQLMQRYYRSAKFISLMNEILLQALREHLAPPGAAPRVMLNARFHACNGRLGMYQPDLLQNQPLALLECFLTLQQHPQLEGFSADLLRAIWRARQGVDHYFRQHPANRLLFMDILRQPSGITETLRRLNRYGVLGRYIPAFGRIVGQMQHDHFHVYTVDEHILNVLHNVRRYSLPQHQQEFPLCSQLMADFDRQEVLYLAALFHDIAKGRGGDHSKLGMVDARRFCIQHGLPREDTELVVWLVEQHLVMSSTAQKSDLADPGVIAAFAALVRDERRLTALYLLTIADIRGTSPAIWNGWKAKLLEQLFLATRRLLRGSTPDREAEQNARRQEARERLGHYAIQPESYKALWEVLDDSYFQRHEGQEIAWQTRMLLRHVESDAPVVRTRLSPGGDGIEVMIYTRDDSMLFARICGFFERLGYSIAEAKIHTTRHGYALDSFLVLNAHDPSVHYRDLMSYIEYELTQKLAAAGPVDPPMHGRLSRQLKHFPIAPEIHWAQKNERQHALDIVAGDRPGLLSRIARTFMDQGVRLYSAKINTLGSRAEDTFLVSTMNGRCLSESELQALAGQLAEQLA